MVNLKEVYIEEAEDLFSKMEDALLRLENAPEDNALIAEIFRSMHTLKGSSGMFGAMKVSDFVHNLETIYDRVRNNEMALNSEIVDVTFRSIDHLKKAIFDSDLEDQGNQKNNDQLTAEILAILEGGIVDGVAAQHKKKAIERTYLVSFKPNSEIFEDGTNPLLLLEELTDLGKFKVFVHMNSGTGTDDFDPTKCYTSWDVLLVTESMENAIRDVFIFVESSSDLLIQELFEGDLLSKPDFIKELPEENLTGDVLSLEQLEGIIDRIGEVEVSPEVEPVKQDTKPSKSEQEKKVQQAFEKTKPISSIRVSANKLDELMNHVSELITTQAGLSLYSKNNFDPALETISDNVEKLSRQLRDIAFGMTLIQIDKLFSRFQRVIRDLSVQLDKSVNFITEGGETELDKTIIESLTDPLMHIVRNSVDHGIESKAERIKKGKPETGTIRLRSYYSGAKVYIQIEDDGKGMDPDKIRDKAIDRGLISKEDKLSKKEIFDLVFTPGFSLAKNVTDISGRGVGMDVVRKNILDIRGEISIESELDIGTTITLGLPLTLSIIDGLLIKVHDTFIIVPLSEVFKCYEIKSSQLNNNFNQLIILDDEQIPYFNLRDEFDINEEDTPETVSIIVVQNRNSKIAICVDSIVGEYQAVLKPVGKYYRNQEFISGATILGDGTVALVLDAFKIIAQKMSKQKITA